MERQPELPAGGSDPPPWRPRGRPDVVFRRVGEDWLLFDPESQEVHVLNLSAALVWSSCNGELDVPSIARDVEEAFDTSDVEVHVDEILDRFVGAGLLEGRGGGEEPPP